MTNSPDNAALIAQVSPEGQAIPAEPVQETPAAHSGPAETAIPVANDASPVEGTQAPSSLIDNIAGFIDLGGPVVAMLLVLSLFAVTIILVKVWQLYFKSGATRGKVSSILSQWLDQDCAASCAAMQNESGPIARVVAFVMSGMLAHRDEAHLREETEHLAHAEIASLRSYLRGLEAVVQVAPLLGLFGTVLGMIEAFRALEAAGTQVNPADLAGGIWVALLTTAVGLAVAMPVSLVLHWFESRIASVRQSMELFATEVMTSQPQRAAKPGKNNASLVRLAAAAEGKRAV